MRVLVADDDMANRKLLEKMLSAYGDVVAVDDGEAALIEATKAMDDKQPFELICLDIVMSDMDGYKTLEKIRKAETDYKLLLDKRAVVIMISALDEVALDSINTCNDYDAYICKPIDLVKFDELLNKMGFTKNK